MNTNRFSALILSLLFLSVTFLSTSCSTDSAVNTNTQETLIANLNNYNKTHINQKDWCSGFWDCAGKVAAVGLADGAGAITGVAETGAAAGVITGGTGGAGAPVGGAVIVAGAVIFAGAASIGMAVALPESKKAAATAVKQPKALVNPKKSKFEGIALNINLPLEYYDFTNIGFEHNTLLFNTSVNGYMLRDVNGNVIDQMPNMPVADYLASKNFTKDELAIFNSQYFVTSRAKMDAIISQMDAENLDISVLTSKLVNEKLMSHNAKEVYDLYAEVFVNCKNAQEQENLANYYISQISSSSLSDTEKLGLISGILVSLESFYFWINE
ncbi:MAG: hypothetical protein DI539_09490 [Flavobacterium psychrophilum]|nr:MAG: hypothetical protein DI539_09490 [Flavobacterium psychrophilum]